MNCIYLGIKNFDIKVGCRFDGNERYSPSHTCNLKKKQCLPEYHPTDAAEKLKWDCRKPESDMFILCGFCKDFDCGPPERGVQLNNASTISEAPTVATP
jgi:hypothetical protein